MFCAIVENVTLINYNGQVFFEFMKAVNFFVWLMQAVAKCNILFISIYDIKINTWRQSQLLHKMPLEIYPYQ